MATLSDWSTVKHVVVKSADGTILSNDDSAIIMCNGVQIWPVYTGVVYASAFTGGLSEDEAVAAFVYTGNAHKVVANSGNGWTASGETTETDSANETRYCYSVTPAESYSWANDDGTNSNDTSTKQFWWYITKFKIIEDGVFNIVKESEFNGQYIYDLDYTNLDSTQDMDKVAISGSPYAITANSYSYIVTINDTSNVTWLDGTTSSYKTYSWKITSAAMTNLSISLAAYTYEYTGSAIEPGVTVKNSNNEIISNSSTKYYTVSYASNTNVGTASVTVTGDGVNITGSKTVYFTIKSKPINLSASMKASSSILSPDETLTIYNVCSGSISSFDTITYQWYRASSIDSDDNFINPTNISNATSSVYKITKDDVGYYIGCTVNATKANYTITEANVENSNVVVATYEITFVDGDGNTLQTLKVTEGTLPKYSGSTPTKTSTAQYNYTWNNTWTPTIVAAYADTTYTALFTSSIRSYRIQWCDDEGNVIYDEDIAYGDIPEYVDSSTGYDHPDKAPDSTSTYTWAGWSPEVVAVTEDATYIATYTANVRTYKHTHSPTNIYTLDSTDVDTSASTAPTFLDWASGSWFLFIPSISATYTISAESSGDTYARLYNANGKQLASNDDTSSTNADFSITYSCTAGTSYYLFARPLSSGVSISNVRIDISWTDTNSSSTAPYFAEYDEYKSSALILTPDIMDGSYFRNISLFISYTRSAGRANPSITKLSNQNSFNVNEVKIYIGTIDGTSIAYSTQPSVGNTQMKWFVLTPNITASYTIYFVGYASNGDEEDTCIRLYNSSKVHQAVSYNGNITKQLTKGSLYYIGVRAYSTNTELSDAELSIIYNVDTSCDYDTIDVSIENYNSTSGSYEYILPVGCPKIISTVDPRKTVMSSTGATTTPAVGDNSMVWYQIIPTFTGTYTFQTNSADLACYPLLRLYTATKRALQIVNSEYYYAYNNITSTGQAKFSYTLYANTTYYLGVRPYSNNTPTISSWGTSPYGVYYRIRPNQTGSYTIESVGDGDTFGVLYDSSTNTLATSYYGGSGPSFKITADLTASTNYYLYAAPYFGSKTLTESLKLVWSYNAKKSDPLVEKYFYIITYDGNGGTYGTTNLKYELVLYNSKGTYPTPTRTGYELSGWILGSTTYTDTSTPYIISDTTFKAVWTAISTEQTYTYTYDPGTITSNASSISTLKTTSPTVGDDAGNWFKVVINSAASTCKFYTVKTDTSTSADVYMFLYDGSKNYYSENDDSGGNLQPAITVSNVAAGTIFYICIRPHSASSSISVINFCIDYTSSSASNPTITKYSSSSSVNYTVTYNANGGSSTVSSESVASGSTGTFPTSTQCTRSGYTLLGWSTSSSATTATYSAGASTPTITANKTYYAVWSENTVTQYTITYYGNGGSPSSSTETVNEGSSGTFPDSTTFSRSGYMLSGWSTSSSATSATYNAGASTSAMYSSTTKIYYAVWTVNSTFTAFYIYYQANNGSSSKTYDYITTSGATGTFPTTTQCTRNGYTLLGWSESSSATVATYNPGVSTPVLTSTKTYYAVWQVTSSSDVTNYCDPSLASYSWLVEEDDETPLFTLSGKTMLARYDLDYSSYILRQFSGLTAGGHYKATVKLLQDATTTGVGLYLSSAQSFSEGVTIASTLSSYYMSTYASSSGNLYLYIYMKSGAVSGDYIVFSSITLEEI